MKTVSLPLPAPLQPILTGIVFALVGVLLVTAALTASPSATAHLFATLMSCSALGWLVAEWHRRPSGASNPQGPMTNEVPESCRELVAGVVAGASHPDSVFRALMQTQLAALADQLRGWSHGQLAFTGTEAWRTAYETVLTAPDVDQYLSVAWLKSSHYWQDAPGQHGLRLNFDLLDQGVRIERLLILGWDLFPPELRLPVKTVHRWIEEQHYRGVSMFLVRESDLVGEPDLLRDFGIYGERAVGELHCDEDSRSVSFTLSFDQASLQLARERWARLRLFARAYAELVEAA